MLNTRDILETIRMIRDENLDIRTVTMGISLFDCISDDEDRLAAKIYDKIYECFEKNVLKTFETNGYLAELAEMELPETDYNENPNLPVTENL